MEDLILVRHLCGVGYTCKNINHHYRAVPGLDFHPCGQLVLLFDGLLQLALHLAAGVVIVQSGQERSELPRVMSCLLYTSQNLLTGFLNGQFRCIQLPAVHHGIIAVVNGVVPAILTGLDTFELGNSK